MIKMMPHDGEESGGEKTIKKKKIKENKIQWNKMIEKRNKKVVMIETMEKNWSTEGSRQLESGTEGLMDVGRRPANKMEKPKKHRILWKLKKTYNIRIRFWI